MIITYLWLLSKQLIQLTKHRFDALDAALLSASGVGGCFAFITNFMNPTLAAALIGLFGVVLRIGFEVWKIRRSEKLKLLQEKQMRVKCFLLEPVNETHWQRMDTGELTTLKDAPPGAMWNAEWLQGFPGWCGDDGLALIVKLPNGNDWHIDGVANNCPDKEDSNAGGHKCWVRHGTAPNITVDKNGNTCNAGGGSISSGSYHGFLRNGEFVDC